MECGRGDVLPFFKQEPNDAPANFIYPENQQSHTHDQAVGSSASDGFVASLSIKPGMRSNFSGMLVGEDGCNKKDSVSIHTHRDYIHSPDIGVSENGTALGSRSGDGVPGSNAFPGPSQQNFTNSVKQTSASLKQFESSDSAEHALKPALLEVSAVPKDLESSQSETVLAIPVEELPPFEQLNLKTDVFMNGEDIQFFNTSEPDHSQKNPRMGNGNKILKANDVKILEDVTQHIAIEASDSEVTPIRRMRKKVGERKRTMQTRSLSGSLPKVCRVKGTVDNSVLKGLGKKQFNCTVCDESFSQRLLLKKHVSEVHEGQPSHIVISDKLFESVTFACPLCDSTFSRKYGLKRHFASRHLSENCIPCPECNYKAKKLSDYLKHVDKHKPVKTRSEASPVEMKQSRNVQLKCRECREIFQSDEALRLHILIHKINLSLSQTESLLPSDSFSNCTCLSSEAKIRNCAMNCVLHSSSYTESTREAGSNLVSFSSLPEELKLVSEQSLDTMSKLTSRLDTLARSVSARGSVPRSQNPLSAINFVGSLSMELTNIATTLGHILFSDGHKNEEVDVNVETVEDLGESDSCNAEQMIQDIIEESADEKVNDVSQKREEELPLCEDVSEPVEPLKLKSRRLKRGRGRKKKVIKCSPNPNESICNECGKDFKDCANLNRHLLTHLDLRPFKCRVCKMAFRRKEHLKRHSVKHTDVRPFKCDICDYAAKTRKTLRTHILIHGEHRCFPCKHCTYTGRTIHELSKHERKHNPCPLCGYIPSDNADYTMHKRSHLSYTCAECDYACYTSWQLRRHLKTHSLDDDDAEKFCCELCGYSCTDKRRFAYHMARHENKTPFSCSVCDYKCSSRSSFDAHKLMHAGLRPFLCSICGASFRRTSHLNNHMLIHKEEKKHVCRTCGRPFRARHNLKQHEMIHTGEKQHKCHLCSFACRRNKELRLHMAKHNPPDETTSMSSYPQEANTVEN